jgi:hypothetical protein
MKKTSRAFSVIVALLAVCVFAAVGYRIGRSTQSSPSDVASAWQSAELAAYPAAKASAYRIAWRSGYKHGFKAGTAAGATAGTRAGRVAGHAESTAGAVAAREVAAVLEATPAKLAPGVKTERCVEVAGGLCEALGPRITGRHCPPGSVADPKGGVVCVPRVLLVAARIAKAPSVSLFTP